MDELPKDVRKQKRKHYTWKERKKYCEAWKSSDLTQIQFCQENGLAIQSFSRWIKELKELSKPKLTFLPVERVSEKKMTLRNKNDFNDNRLDLEIQLKEDVMCRFTGILLVDIYRLMKVLRHDFADIALHSQ